MIPAPRANAAMMPCRTACWPPCAPSSLPACNGVAATIVLTMTPEQIQTKTGLVTTGHGALITVEQALSLAGDARVMPVVLTKTREITAYGDTHRIFTEGQRLALIARDQGCSFPGCSVGPAWCQAHHITDFAISRRTSVDDGTLLCGFHHRAHPTLRLDLPNDQRHTTLDPTTLARPPADPTTQPNPRTTQGLAEVVTG